MKLMLGADPEVFVGDDNGVKSIIGKIGGTKEFPRPLFEIGEGFAVQEDNVALEFNIPASKNKREFVRNITKATSFLETMVHDMHGYKFVKDSAVSFPEEELQDVRSHVFGCDPDFNAWTKSINPKPRAQDRNLRSCGGHVHVGCGPDFDITSGVKWCDLMLSVPAVKMDTGLLRKSLYGKAGAFRAKPYGFEYRSLSNFWIFNKRYIGWVYDNTKRALVAVKAGRSLDEDQDAILDAINNNNHKAADYLIEKYDLEVVNA